MENDFLKHNYHNFIYTCVCFVAAPCAPEILNMMQTNNSTYSVLFTTPNTPNTNYTITAIGHYDKHTCQTKNNSCELTQLPCGSTYEVTAVATTTVGRSLPGFSKPLETGMIGHHFGLKVKSNLFRYFKITLGARYLCFYPFFAFLAVMDQPFKAFYIHCINYQYPTNTIKYSTSKK